jgi:hypothetical protein
MLIREATDADAATVARLLLEADDTRVVSIEGVLHRRRSRLSAAGRSTLVAEIDGAVVATGVAGR